ncbi:MAG: UDP-2,3-diacylglucosamine diphosphatase LpxI [Rhodospirillales bacterium]|nr:UDP-2,3-diacylglucosamine diphosphatase LpxI [Rhodospirillales bacterium]
MSAPPESRVDDQIPAITRLGIIAGGGGLPSRLVAACDKAGIDVFIVGFEGQTDPQVFSGRKHLLTRLGAAGHIFKTLKERKIDDLVLIGSIRRPSLAELRPDIRTAGFFARLGVKALGDDGILSALREEIESEGFTVHPVQDFARDLLMPEGLIGKKKPSKADQADIERGIEVSQALGALDVGQSVIVQEGIVLGVEGVEGTDALIRRCKAYKRAGRGGVLVKTCKPQQDIALDLPTMGPETVRLCAEAGLAGIIVQAGTALLLEPEEVAGLADKNKMFVMGVVLKPQDQP